MQAMQSWFKRKRTVEGGLDQAEASDVRTTGVDKRGKTAHTSTNQNVKKGDCGLRSVSSHLEASDGPQPDIQIDPLGRMRENANPSKAIPNVESEEYGIHVLVDKSKNQDNIVDIVALHGLHGHYIKTWTATSDTGEQKNWLKDFLPQQIPNIRVMSYNYNSALQLSKSVADSLGGLVFKKALIHAHERQRRYQVLLDKINGVMFFGTPHRGSALASWGTVLANLLRIASFGTSTNSPLVEHLKEHSKALEEISTSFVDRGKDLDIFTFYETDKMDFLNCEVVPKSSAVLDLPNEISIPIFGNHRTICRFKSQDENRYRVVWRNLEGMVKQLIDSSLGFGPEMTRDMIRCIQRLYVSNYEAHRERNPLPVPGTCKWFLSHKKYLNWVDEVTPSLLWVSADPGCGKSVLASFLVDHLRSADSKSRLPGLVSYFFFKDDSDEQKTSTLALRAILHQIFREERALLKHAKSHWDTTGEVMFSLSEGFEVLWQIFMDVLKDPKSSNIICILDGLDECEKRSQGQLLKSLVGYYTSGKTSKAYLKVLITSHPDNSITFAFRRLPTVRLRGEDEVEAISKDVELVIQENMKGLL